MPIKVGPLEAVQGDKSPSRMALMLWGPSSAGKTTFAATAPGDKLWLSFGDNEANPVLKRKDVFNVDLSVLDFDELFKHAQNANPFGLDKTLAENENIGTVVVDSATSIAYSALQKAVLSDRVGAGRDFNPTMMAPGIAAYGGRNAIVLETLSGLLRVTAKHNVHIVITAHEDDPTMRNEVVGGRMVEIIDHIAVSLGGKLVNNVTWRLSEIWHLREMDGGGRQLSVRLHGKRRPMKTRMFDTKGKAFFPLRYDPNKSDNAKGQMTIAAWHDEWLNGKRSPLSIPSAEGA